MTRIIAVLTLMCAGFLANQATAGEQPAYRLTSRTIPERGQVAALEMTVGGQKVSLILPKGWRVGEGSEGLVLQAADFSATLTLKAARNSELLSKELKESMAPLAPRVVFGEDTAYVTGLGDAMVIDAQMGEDDELSLKSRTFIIRLKDSSLVVNLTADSNKFEKAQILASGFVASLRLE